MTNKEISINAILLYARKIRDIQRHQIDPYMDQISKELQRVYPWLKNKNEHNNCDSDDWTCDIVSEDSDATVRKTLKRIEDIGRDNGHYVIDEPPSNDDVLNSILDRLNTIEQRLESLYNERQN